MYASSYKAIFCKVNVKIFDKSYKIVVTQIIAHPVSNSLCTLLKDEFQCFANAYYELYLELLWIHWDTRSDWERPTSTL